MFEDAPQKEFETVKLDGYDYIYLLLGRISFF